MPEVRFLRLRALPAMAGVFWIIMGVHLLMPYRSFDASPAWDTMRQVMPEPYWGLALIATGIAVLQPYKPLVRWGALLLVVAAAISFFVSVAAANWRAPSAGAYFGVTVGCAWAFLQGTADIRLPQRRKRLS